MLACHSTAEIKGRCWLHSPPRLWSMTPSTRQQVRAHPGERLLLSAVPHGGRLRARTGRQAGGVAAPLLWPPRTLGQSSRELAARKQGLEPDSLLAQTLWAPGLSSLPVFPLLPTRVLAAIQLSPRCHKGQLKSRRAPRPGLAACSLHGRLSPPFCYPHQPATWVLGAQEAGMGPPWARQAPDSQRPAAGEPCRKSGPRRALARHPAPTHPGARSRTPGQSPRACPSHRSFTAEAAT